MTNIKLNGIGAGPREFVDTLSALKLLDRKVKSRTESVEFATKKGTYDYRLNDCEYRKK